MGMGMGMGGEVATLADCERTVCILHLTDVMDDMNL